jgi:hypothetical protein
LVPQALKAFRGLQAHKESKVCQEQMVKTELMEQSDQQVHKVSKVFRATLAQRDHKESKDYKERLVNRERSVPQDLRVFKETLVQQV